ncbi:hypothetical protein EPI10_031920 [Gossypium australe]|uniref:Uncharacterized protein n=1 Tax=Gossypium australe TaxID=47621 RepID=A0A5B6X568_9ROSI|nr:hypothetical protein EPI10_031920 [Gossypium australe]
MNLSFSSLGKIATSLIVFRFRSEKYALIGSWPISFNGSCNRTGEAKSKIFNASPSTSTCKKPDSAPKRIAWTQARASTANAVASKLILTFQLFGGFQFSLAVMLRGAIQFLALSKLLLQRNNPEKHALWFLQYYCILGKSQSLLSFVEPEIRKSRKEVL